MAKKKNPANVRRGKRSKNRGTAFERTVANFFGVQRVLMSGADPVRSGSAGDVVVGDVLIEAKTRAAVAFTKWFEGASVKAEKEDRLPALAIKKFGDRGFFLVLHSSDFDLVASDLLNTRRNIVTMEYEE